jgi:hypothetical protein
MAAEDARKARSKSRARRRQDESSSPPPDAVEHEPTQDGDDSLGTVKQAAKVAAVGAAVGAATAAARALTHQDRAGDEQDEHSSDEPASGGEDEAKGEAEGQESSPAEEPQDEESDEPQDQPEEPEREEPEREQPEQERPPEPVRGAGTRETQAALREARAQLESLLGKSPESVSSFERTQDGWLISFEVLELSRVPETTDVLASYEVELDESCGLRRYARVRRYARSQANGDDR